VTFHLLQILIFLPYTYEQSPMGLPSRPRVVVPALSCCKSRTSRWAAGQSCSQPGVLDAVRMSRFQMLSDIQRSLIEEILPRPTDAAEYKISSGRLYAFAKGTFCLMPISGKHPRLFVLKPNPHSYPAKMALGGEARGGFTLGPIKFCMMKWRPSRQHRHQFWRCAGTKDRTGPGTPAHGPNGQPDPAARIQAGSRRPSPGTTTRNQTSPPAPPASQPASSASSPTTPAPWKQTHQNSTRQPPADTSAPGPPFRGKPPRSCRSPASSTCPSKTDGVSPPNQPN
jgi:hypothetical protein